MPRGRPRKNFGLKNFGLIFLSLIQRKKKQVNITYLRDCPGTGWGAKFFFYVFFVGSSLMGEKKHINKVPPQNPGTIP